MLSLYTCHSKCLIDKADNTLMRALTTAIYVTCDDPDHFTALIGLNCSYSWAHAFCGVKSPWG